MRLGVSIQSDQLGPDPDDVRKFARACEEAGYDYVVVLDHVLGADTSTRPDWSGYYSSANAFREAFVLLGFIAGVAPKLGLATGVLVLPQRPTGLVAKQVAELDMLCGGRMRLGIGIGWNQVEIEALGYEFGNRAARYEEQIELLRRLWTEPSVYFVGKYHQLDRVGINPLPVQRPVPLWMGGGMARPVLERIGRLGDGWVVMGNVQLPDDETKAALGIVRESAARAGRDPDGIGIEGRLPLRGRVDEDEIKAELAAWRRLGADYVSVHGLPAGRPVDEYVDLIHRIRPLLDA